MKKPSYSLLLLTLITTLVMATSVPALAYDVAEDAAIEVFEEISAYLLLSNPERTVIDVLSDIADEYDMTDDELFDFLVAMTEYHYQCIWIPVHGGKKFHDNADCSNMRDPRPTTKEAAYNLGYAPCKRCHPGD